MKRVIALVLVLALFNSIGLNISYADSPSNWANPEIEELKNTGYFEEGRFSDFQKPITRGEFIYFAARLFEVMSGEEIEVSKDISFSDTTDIWALKSASVGITDGVGNGSFGLNQLLTREQLAAMLIRTLKLGNLSLNTPDGYIFSDDSEISSWARESVYLAKANGIIDGMGNGNMAPKDSATVEQCIAIINRILKDNAGKSDNVSYDNTKMMTKDFTQVGNSAQYYGEIKNGLLDGLGIMTNLEGEPFHIGEFKENKIQGLGVQFRENQMLIGHFENSQLNGFGLIVDLNMGYIVSNFDNDKFNGLLINIDLYENVKGSYWEDGIFYHNIGDLFTKEENVEFIEFQYGTYLGQIKNGLPNGEGLLEYNTGETYVGEFVNGKLHGQGTQILNSNEIYIGLFQNNQFTGNGFVCLRPSDDTFYIGEMKDYHPGGYGVNIYDSGTINLGNFANHDIQDRWIYIDSYNHIYVGDFEGKHKNGEGLTLFSNGGIYIGEYEKGLKVGQGAYRYPDGSINDGLWVNDKFVGE